MPVKNQSSFVKLYGTSVLDTLLAAKIERKTDSAGVFSFHNHKFIVPALACRGKKITVVMSEKLGIKASLRGKLYDIRYADFFDNKQVKTHMPEVTRTLIDRYLRSGAKETSRDDLFRKRAGGW
jgi:hypothetical protein